MYREVISYSHVNLQNGDSSLDLRHDRNDIFQSRFRNAFGQFISTRLLQRGVFRDLAFPMACWDADG